MRKLGKKKITAFLVIASACVCTGAAEANTTNNFSWDSALKKLADSLTGPVAFSLGLFMIVCGFCATAFMGSELGGWVRWVALAAILAGMLGAAPSVLGMFGLASAMVA